MIEAINHDVNFLRQVARLATKNDLPVAKNLKDTLLGHQSDCLGLAANMIGQSIAIIAVFIGPVPVVMINPQITKKAGPYQTKEGCLSLTGKRNCQRYHKIAVRYQNEQFDQQAIELTGLAAETVQHEMDHLAGKII